VTSYWITELWRGVYGLHFITKPMYIITRFKEGNDLIITHVTCLTANNDKIIYDDDLKMVLRDGYTLSTIVLLDIGIVLTVLDIGTVLTVLYFGIVLTVL
jgi:hypothetical protein